MYSSKLQLKSSSEQETFEFGRRLGSIAYGGLAILLYGGLGMGKTRLTQGIGNALGANKIKSPTFILVNEYDTLPPLIHADLYRLETEREADSLALEDYLDDGCLLVVEWSEHWKNIPVRDVLKITFEQTDENGRLLTFEALGDRVEELLRKLAE